MVKFETPRLILRQPAEGDLEPLAAMNADPEVMRYIGDGRIRTREETAAGLARAREEWETHGRGVVSVDLRESGRFIGWVALTEPAFLPEILPAIEIGWRFARESWGRGYATEAARVALRFGFEELGLDRIVSIRHIDNVASGRIMEKLGMRFERETVVPASGQPVVVYAITKAEFEAGAAES